MPVRLLRHYRTCAVIVLLATARAAYPFLTTSTSGTELKAQFFPVTYDAPPGQLWSVSTHLVFVSRATISQGTLVHTARLAGNSVPRAVQGSSSLQVLTLKNTAGSSTLASDTGPPSETLVASYSVPWDKQATIFSYPLFLAFDVEVNGVTAICGTSTGCSVRYTDIILPSRAAIAIGGVELPRPTLLLRSTRYFDLASAGLSPFAEWASLSVDHIELTKIPFLDGYGTPPALQWYRHPVRQGDATKSGDPLPPTQVEFPSNENGIEDFLSCGGGGCGTHQARVGLGDGAIPTGLHTITLATRPYAGGSFKFYDKMESVGSGDAGDPQHLSTSFILFGPLVEVESTQAGPGQIIVVRGSGFAPNSQVRLAALFTSSSRSAALGLEPTDVTGSFTAQRTLPPAGDPFFADVLARGPQDGVVRAQVEDAEFLADYFGGIPQYDDVTIRFLPTAVGPVGTTTTTIPGGGTVPPGELNGPACTDTPVPAKAEQKFEKAVALVDEVEQLIIEHAAKKKLRKLIGKAQGALQRARGLMNRARKKGLVSEGCANAAVDLIDDLAASAQALRDDLR